MKQLIDKAIKATTPDQFKKESDLIIQLIDPQKQSKEWVPSKIKK
jgi:hypothetical protein